MQCFVNINHNMNERIETELLVFRLEPEFECWDCSRQRTKDVQNEFIKSQRPYQRLNYYAPDFQDNDILKRSFT